MEFTIENGNLLKCEGNDKEIIIPEEVTSIYRDAFKNCANTTCIYFPSGLTFIADWVFYNTLNNVKLYFPNLEAFMSMKHWGYPDPRRGRKVYIGNELFTEVTIPEGTDTINAGAFINCSDLSKVYFPNSMKTIGNGAFSGCTSLRTLEIPDSVTEIGNAAFSDCTNLENVKLSSNLTEIKQGVFARCGKLIEVEIPASVHHIRERAFENCGGLLKITIPDTVETIGEFAYASCSAVKEMSISPEKTKFEKNSFHLCYNVEKYIIPGGIQTTSKVSTALLRITHFKLPPEDMAYIGLYQGDKKWKEWFYDNLDQQDGKTINTVAMHMSEALKNNGKIAKPVQDRVADFMAKYQKKLKPETVQALQSCFGSADTAIERTPKKAPKQLNASEVMQKEKKRMVSWLENRGITEKSFVGMGADAQTVEAAMFVIYAYGRQMSKEPVYHAKTYKTDIMEVNFSADADEIAKTIDRKFLMDAIQLKKPTISIYNTCDGWERISEPILGNVKRFEEECESWAINPDKAEDLAFLLPLCRFADATTIKTLTRNADYMMRKLSMPGRRAAIAIRSGLLLSDTKEAAAYLDKFGQLDLYASIRGKTAASVRSEIASNPAMDEEGTVDFGLSVEARLTNDLNLILFDPDKDKEVKSFPKKGNDATKLKKAEAQYKELKQSVKTTVSSQKVVLKKMFLSGEKIKAEQWKTDYLGNPILMRIAQLLVWKQGQDLFTVSNKKTINHDQSEQLLSDEEICLAHPIEMTDKQIRDWQDYFSFNDLKQFFAQVWEPVAFRDLKDIQPDRYENCQITVGHILSLQNQDLGYCDFNIDGPSDFVFAGEMIIPGHFDYAVHFLNERGPDNAIILHKISSLNIKEPRKLNRVIAYLDQRIIPDKIRQDDDAFLMRMLSGKTLVQIREYLELAIENNAEKCKALLLDYQNKHYADYEYISEFTLD